MRTNIWLLSLFLLYSLTITARNGNGDDLQKLSPPSEPSAGPGETAAGIRMIPIPAGAFRMGSDWGNDPRNPHRRMNIYKAEVPVHTVFLSAFRMSATEITQRQYRAVMGKNPSRFTGDDRLPAERVTWRDAVRFCNLLSDRAGFARCYDARGGACDFTKDGFRLPTEAEWEYACRAGTDTQFNTGETPSLIVGMPSGWEDSLDTASDLGRAGWYSGNSGNRNLMPFFLDPKILKEADCRPHPVGGKTPNAWGLYDMHGNVYEWCNDRYGLYSEEAVSDPAGAAKGDFRVKRGGGWGSYSNRCNSVARSGNKPDTRNSDLGFRVVRRAP